MSNPPNESSELREARLQLFDISLPGDKRVARMITEIGVVATRDRLLRECDLNDAEAIETRIYSVGASFITPEDEQWPSGLHDLAIGPIGLIIRGELGSNRSVAIVGTRNPSSYGLRIARTFASGIVDHDLTVISGGALGIDTAAHQGALDNEGRTIAVLAGGIDLDYPASNSRLFEEIAQRGALISEVMPGVAARPERFLTRNRLIAAIASSTLVVEAAYRSGSLRTARDAAELLRPVMAVPGPITSPLSEGCHQLIADRAAEIVTSLSDLIELVDPWRSETSTVGSCSSPDSSPSSGGPIPESPP